MEDKPLLGALALQNTVSFEELVGKPNLATEEWVEQKLEEMLGAVLNDSY